MFLWELLTYYVGASALSDFLCFCFASLEVMSEMAFKLMWSWEFFDSLMIDMRQVLFLILGFNLVKLSLH